MVVFDPVAPGDRVAVRRDRELVTDHGRRARIVRTGKEPRLETPSRSGSALAKYLDVGSAVHVIDPFSRNDGQRRAVRAEREGEPEVLVGPIRSGLEVAHRGELLAIDADL